MPDLANIERVELREAWPNEASDFTPWLAEHIEQLGTALGVRLERLDEEAPVGGYSLDILARDLDGDRLVVIENQLEATDHSHLGQLLTYAAGYDAYMVVWVTRDFRDEHRQALDWLNQRTDEQTHFFGVVVELWKIDGSRPAPHFKLAAAPNDWRKQNITRRQAIDRGSEQAANRTFREGLEEKLSREHRFLVHPMRPGARAWCTLEKDPDVYEFSCDFFGGNLWVNLWFDGPSAEQNLANHEPLMNDQMNIEAKIIDSTYGERVWWKVPGRSHRTRVSVARPGDIHENPDSWDEYHEWIIKKFFKFKEVFGPYLEELTQQ